jgi:hypothetical protein
MGNLLLLMEPKGVEWNELMAMAMAMAMVSDRPSRDVRSGEHIFVISITTEAF